MIAIKDGTARTFRDRISPGTRLMSAMRPDDCTIDVEDDDIQAHDIVEIIDPYPGQTMYLDYSTLDLAHVVAVRKGSIDVIPIAESTLRAHPVGARVRVISRVVQRDFEFVAGKGVT